ncbi:MAG: hypothetical protein ACLR17_22100 [Enterobacteriaceae bacterium]
MVVIARQTTLEQLETLSAEQKAKMVLVVQDQFTSYYDAQVVADFVRLVEKWATSRYCCRSRQTARRSISRVPHALRVQRRKPQISQPCSAAGDADGWRRSGAGAVLSR